MASQNEIQVSGMGGLTKVVSEAAAALETHNEVILSGINSGIPNVVQAAELLKHRLIGLYQLNTFEKVPDSTKTRLTIKLGKNQLDVRHTGYQPPIPSSQVEVKSFEELKKPPPRPERPVEESKGTPGGPESSVRGTRGRGTRGRGRGTRGGGRDRSAGGRERGGRATRGGRRGARRGRDRFNSGPRVGGQEGHSEDKYVRVPTKQEHSEQGPDEILISQRRPVKLYIKDLVLHFKREGKSRVVLKASGYALSTAVTVAENIKRAVRGLHQISSFSKRTVTDVYEPKEQGLDTITKDRTVPALEIILSTAPLDTTDPGYQAPLPDSEVKELTAVEVEAY